LKTGSFYEGNQKEYWDVPPYEILEIISVSDEPASSIFR
jgi:hypothetical protein